MNVSFASLKVGDKIESPAYNDNKVYVKVSNAWARCDGRHMPMNPTDMVTPIREKANGIRSTKTKKAEGSQAGAAEGETQAQEKDG